MREPPENGNDPVAIAFSALTWVLADDRRASRLLELTGLSGEDVRARFQDPALLRAVIEFLEHHEPDLIACSAAIGVAPIEIVSARQGLAG